MSENGQTTPKRGEQTAPDPAANIHTTPDRGARLGAPLEPDYDPDWDWYLNEAPAILGERGNLQGVVAQVEQGTVGARTVANTGPQHEAMIRVLPAVARARRLDQAWKRITPEHQTVLRARYLQRRRWPTGCHVHLAHLTGVALLLSPDPRGLRSSCLNATKREHARVIARDLATARKAVRAAHAAGKEALRGLARDWAEGQP